MLFQHNIDTLLMTQTHSPSHSPFADLAPVVFKVLHSFLCPALMLCSAHTWNVKSHAHC